MNCGANPAYRTVDIIDDTYGSRVLSVGGGVNTDGVLLYYNAPAIKYAYAVVDYGSETLCW